MLTNDPGTWNLYLLQRVSVRCKLLQHTHWVGGGLMLHLLLLPFIGSSKTLMLENKGAHWMPTLFMFWLWTSSLAHNAHKIWRVLQTEVPIEGPLSSSCANISWDWAMFLFTYYVTWKVAGSFPTSNSLPIALERYICSVGWQDGCPVPLIV